jgi:predicted nucleic acid-binding protein
MIVVANASALIGLSAIDRLDLLQARFPNGILIPDAVWHEVVEAGEGRPGAQAVRAAGWIRRQVVGNRAWVRLLRTELDEGEAEAIVLASELGAGMVLLDERDARRLAERVGLRVLGTVGILVWARRVGRIESLRAELDALEGRGRFRLSRTLRERALREVGEA